MRAELTGDVCEGQGDFSVAAGISSPLNPSYVAHVVHDRLPRDVLGSDEEFEEFWSTVTVEEISSVGECMPSAGCDLKSPPESGWSDGWSGRFEHLVYFENGETRTASTSTEILRLFGAIDTPEEAAFLAQLEGYRPQCDGEPQYKMEGEDFVFYAETGTTCGSNLYGHLLTVSPDGTVTEDKRRLVERGQKGCQIGRLPSSGVTSESLLPADLGEYFSEVAQLESLSVAAFRQIAEQLRAWGAPGELIAWANQCAEEEESHAIATDGLALNFGGERAVPQVAPAVPSSLFALAAENVVEGLTREAFGGLLATHQALYAKDESIRSAMRQIALDEVRHAEFSLALHEWFKTRLSQNEHEKLAMLHQESIQAFRQGLREQLPGHLLAAAGLPTYEASLKLFDGLFEQPS